MATERQTGAGADSLVEAVEKEERASLKARAQELQQEVDQERLSLSRRCFLAMALLYALVLALLWIGWSLYRGSGFSDRLGHDMAVAFAPVAAYLAFVVFRYLIAVARLRAEAARASEQLRYHFEYWQP